MTDKNKNQKVDAEIKKFHNYLLKNFTFILTVPSHF